MGDDEAPTDPIAVERVAAPETVDRMAAPGGDPICATPRIEALTGTAGRMNEHYPDNVSSTVTWQRVSSSGCVDRYRPTGSSSYTYAIPGAFCQQTLTPTTASVDSADGMIEIDRSTSPASYTGRGATTWSVTWSCVESDGTTSETTFDGGGLWFDSSGTVGTGGIAGERVEEDGTVCGRGDSSLPCTYTWSFTPAA